MSTQHRTIHRAFSESLQAMRNCEKSGNAEWHGRWLDYIAKLQSELPHGGGLNGKVEFILDKSNATRVVIFVEFHHMKQDTMLAVPIMKSLRRRRIAGHTSA